MLYSKNRITLLVPVFTLSSQWMNEQLDDEMDWQTRTQLLARWCVCDCPRSLNGQWKRALLCDPVYYSTALDHDNDYFLSKFEVNISHMDEH